MMLRLAAAGIACVAVAAFAEVGQLSNACDRSDDAQSIRMTLNQELTGEPVLVNSGSSPSQAAARSALLAIGRCQPFKLLPAKYDLWKEVEIMFDASIVW